MSTDPVIEQIINARVNLLIHQPFFGNLATRLKIQDASTWCDTAATDGRHIFYNRDFIKGLTKEQLVFLIGHEVLHCVYDHLGRRGSRDPALWNMANDYIVNYTLKKHKVGKMPEKGLYSDQYTDDYTSEEIYKLLIENSVQIEETLDQHLDLGDDDSRNQKAKGKGNGNSGEDGDDEGNGQGGGQGGMKAKATITDPNGPPQLSDTELENIRNEMKGAIMQAAQACNDAGQVPAGIRRLLKDLNEPKLDWKALLEMHIQSAIKDDFTFRRPSRRSWDLGIILPGQNIMDTIDVMIWIDTSGSISDEMLRDFLSETKGIMETFPDFKLKLGTFDTQPYNVQQFTPENLDEIDTYDPQGGGGTDFMAMYHWMEANDYEPQKMVVFTDGYPCGEWGIEEVCPDTLWIIHYDDSVEPPFGMKVLYDVNGGPYGHG